jgi:capsular polysaccharide biosynthesis protein
VDTLNTLDRRSVVATYAKIPSSRTVRTKALEQLGISGAQRYAYYVRSTVVPDTNIIEVLVEGPAPGTTAEMANAVSQQAREYVRHFYGIYGLKVLDPARPSTLAVKPRIGRNLGVSLVFGLFLGIVTALLLEFRRSPGQTSGTSV